MPPARSTPFTSRIVLACAGAAWAIGCHDIAVLLLVGFDTFLRSGELFKLTERNCLIAANKVVINILDSKMGLRLNRPEVVVCQGLAARLLKAYLSKLQPGDMLLRRSPYKARQVLSCILEALELSSYGFTWYSLRRGGATTHFVANGNIEQTLEKGRWASTRSARAYITRAVAETVTLSLGPHHDELFAYCIRQLPLQHERLRQ